MMDEEDRDIDLELDGVVSWTESRKFICSERKFLTLSNLLFLRFSLNKDNDDLASESGLGGQYDNKRALHNAMERKRRDSIKDSFRGQYIRRFLYNNKFLRKADTL